MDDKSKLLVWLLTSTFWILRLKLLAINFSYDNVNYLLACLLTVLSLLFCCRTCNQSGSPGPVVYKKVHFIKNMRQYDTRGSRWVSVWDITEECTILGTSKSVFAEFNYIQDICIWLDKVFCSLSTKPNLLFNTLAPCVLEKLCKGSDVSSE